MSLLVTSDFIVNQPSLHSGHLSREFGMLTIALLLSASAPSAPVPKALVELVTNGSFEEGPDVDMWHSMPVGSMKIKGWKTTRGKIDYIGTQWAAEDGKRSIDLHGSPGFGGIKQRLNVKKGKTYTVTFLMASTPGGVPSEKSLWVEAAGVKKKFTFDAKGKTKDKMGWELKKWEFTADEDVVELEFYTAESEDENQGPAIDSVSVKGKE